MPAPMAPSAPSLSTSPALPICTSCGTQYPTSPPLPVLAGIARCRVCDDPRQFVPESGQEWTSLEELRGKGRRNVFERVGGGDGEVGLRGREERVWEIWTEPKVCMASLFPVLNASYEVGIGQSARLIQTPEGNVLWDLVAYLDEDTVKRIEELGGLKAIVISHPHFYTTWADWSSTFKCPVYTSQADMAWLNRQSHPSATHVPLTQPSTEILPNVTAHICGGHFPGSLVLNTIPPATTLPSLFVADTIFAVAASHNPPPHNPKPGDGRVSYSFLWSIPNFVPLSADEILKIWRMLKPLEFRATYGVMAKASDVFEVDGEEEWGGLKRRVLESAKIAVRRMGGEGHALLLEEL